MRIIRHAAAGDLGRIMEVLAAAKQVMRRAGNVNQWINGYPHEAAILSDMERGGAMVVEDDGVVVAYFAFLPSPEPTYAAIYGGAWLDDTLPYHVCTAWVACPRLAAFLTALWTIALGLTQTSASIPIATTRSCSTSSRSMASPIVASSTLTVAMNAWLTRSCKLTESVKKI